MRVLQKLPPRWRSLIDDAMKFGIVGAVNTVIDFVVFNLLLQIGPLKANVVSTVVATTTSYAMNRQWTFRNRARRAVRREYTLFFAFNLVGMLIQLGVLALVKYGFGFTEDTDRLILNIAKAAGIGVAMVFRFWAYRTFVFAPQHEAGDGAAPVGRAAAVAAPAGGATADGSDGGPLHALEEDLDRLAASVDARLDGAEVARDELSARSRA